MKNTLNGFIVINKLKGEESNKITRRISWMLKTKAGHCGTLDPMASGLLIVALGKYTKFIEYANTSYKKYEFDVKWGLCTDTGDSEGVILHEELDVKQLRPSDEMLYSYIKSQIGIIEQVPHKFSACKINGKRSYELARKNIDFELKPKKITIKNFNIIKSESDITSFEAEVSTGTYIRSIVRDMCRDLNCRGHAVRIHRTKIGGVDLNDSCFFNDIEIMFAKYLQPLKQNKQLKGSIESDKDRSENTMSKECGNNENINLQELKSLGLKKTDQFLVHPSKVTNLETLILNQDEYNVIKHGMKVQISQIADGKIYIAEFRGELVAICKASGGVLYPKKVLCISK